MIAKLKFSNINHAGERKQTELGQEPILISEAAFVEIDGDVSNEFIVQLDFSNFATLCFVFVYCFIFWEASFCSIIHYYRMKSFWKDETQICLSIFHVSPCPCIKGLGETLTSENILLRLSRS